MVFKVSRLKNVFIKFYYILFIFHIKTSTKKVVSTAPENLKSACYEGGVVEIACRAKR